MAKVGELPEFEKLTLESLEPVADPSLEVLDLLKVISGLFSSIYRISWTFQRGTSLMTRNRGDASRQLVFPSKWPNHVNR
jgi:hypothetical protein